MSMPTIPNITPIINITREKAINMLMASIAMEEIGLSNIINAESEKIKYVLKQHHCNSASIEEVKDINQSVEKVMRSIMKIQFLLQDKLENIINTIPKEKPHNNCNCNNCIKNKCKPILSIVGTACGYIDNNCTPLNYGVFNIETNLKQMKDSSNLSLKYTIYKKTKKHNIFVLLLAIPESISLYYDDTSNKSIIKGKGVMSFNSQGKLLQQSTVDFTCTLWNYSYNQKLRMITTSTNTLFNYDSDVLLIRSGCLKNAKYYN